MWGKERFKPHFGGILWFPAHLLSLILCGSLNSSNHYQTITSWQIDGETMETETDFIFWARKSLQMVTAAMKLKDACSWKKSYDPPRHSIKKQRHYFANKVPSSQSYGFPEVMYGCESWTIKKAEC